MTSVVGIDLGSHLIKAALTSSTTDNPEPLPLDGGNRSTALPFVVRIGEDAGAAWDQYFRRRSDFSVAFAFRDRVWAADAALAVAGRGWGAASLLTPLLAGLRKSLMAAAPGVAALGISVPDHWPRESPWALPEASANDGWSPTLLACESVAVLSDWLPRAKEPSLRRLVVLSLGGSSAWASLLTRSDDGGWQLQETRRDDAVSGSILRQMLVAAVAKEVIVQLRKDPTESASEDQNLCDAVEQLLQRLTIDRHAAFEAVLFGSPFTATFSCGPLSQLCQPLLERIGQTLSDWCVQFSRSGPVEAVLYWGDLTARLALTDVVPKAFPNAEAHLLDAYCVARGVARLVALAHAGKISSNVRTGENGAPLYQVLPGAAAGPRAVGPRARLIRQDASARREFVIGDALRLGRSPQADCVLEDDHGEVSNAHAVIIRKGSLYVLSDLQSTNGTYLNGRLLSGPAPLNHGDVVTLAVGGPSFRFENR